MERPGSKSGSSSQSSGQVKAPMHGVVKELLVELGATVTAGQKLFIFEAMKMESEVVAPKAGKISVLNAKAGDTIEAEHVIIEIAD